MLMVQALVLIQHNLQRSVKARPAFTPRPAQTTRAGLQITDAATNLLKIRIGRELDPPK